MPIDTSAIFSQVVETDFHGSKSSFEAKLEGKLEAKLNLALKDILHSTDWQYGEIWLPLNYDANNQQSNPDSAMDHHNVLLELSQVWAVDQTQSFLELHAWENFWSCSRGFLVNAGEGLPGRAWSNGQWEWISDASTHSEHHFLRHQIARAFQVKAGLSVPLSFGGLENVSDQRRCPPDGVALFFMSEGRGQDGWLIQNTLEVLAKYDFVS